MEKQVAKILKSYGNKKIEILKRYRAKSFLEKDKTTTAITGTRVELNQAIANVLEKGSKGERKMLAKGMRETFYEDWSEGKVIKY